MTQISINDSALQQRLSQLASRVADLTPANRSIGEYMLRRTRHRFDTQISPDGTPWKTLAASTIKAKRRRQQTGKPYRTNASPEAILKDTFTLRDSITYLPTSDSVVIGTNIQYGIYPQSDQPRTRVPYRPFLGLDDADRSEIVAIIGDYLDSLF
jgi:phage virion morphogenesis protein